MRLMAHLSDLNRRRISLSSLWFIAKPPALRSVSLIVPHGRGPGKGADPSPPSTPWHKRPPASARFLCRCEKSKGPLDAGKNMAYNLYTFIGGGCYGAAR